MIYLDILSGQLLIKTVKIRILAVISMQQPLTAKLVRQAPLVIVIKIGDADSIWCYCL